MDSTRTIGNRHMRLVRLLSSILGFLFLFLFLFFFCLDQRWLPGWVLASLKLEVLVPTNQKLLPPSPSELSPQSIGDDGSTNNYKCDLFDGWWVYDPKNYPLYEAHQCPFLSDQVSCMKNGRPDSGYEHWRWEARGCEIPRFNGTEMLERLRGKRVVIVGDSLNRNQWESLTCLLYSSTDPQQNLVELGSDYRIFRAKAYDCTVEFFWSPFVVALEGTEAENPKLLKLDEVSESAPRWRGADVMVFNTGHWWTHRGNLRRWNYSEGKGEVVENVAAFEMALKTWAQWIDRWVDSSKTTVFFRSISPKHKGSSGHWCYNQTNPITNETYVQRFPRSMVSIVERVIREMRTPVKYLNITRLSEHRRDAHTAVYTSRQGKLLTLDQQKQPKMYSDCTHWCLPGLPDTWNVLLYASIMETGL